MDGMMYLVIGLILIEIVMEVFTSVMSWLRRMNKSWRWVNLIGVGATQSEEVDTYGKVVDVAESVRMKGYCKREDCNEIKLNESIGDSS